MELSAIYQPVEADLAQVEASLKSMSQVDFPYLSEMLNYSLQSSGKRIRPALTLLSGQFYNYDLTNLLPMATAAEVLHTATLVHDDAIDNSPTRRGRSTVYKVWGEEKAILLGDYLFAEAGALTATTQNLRVIRLFADTLKTISSGELNQAFNAFNLEQSHEQYFQRVSQKTAALFRMSTESGAVLSQAPEASIQILVEYAQNLGIAFQIVDDILDFIGTEEELGKPVGSDLTQGTLTLPAIMLLEQYPENNPVKRFFTSRTDQRDIKQAIELVRNSSIIAECYQVAEDYCSRACQNLILLPDNASRESLFVLADFITSRKR
ncbi:MAG: polyprenyl synthetase family protein [Dehalococcoidales bacterium]|nr:polyprenyl synthetase family protein [Dehalococcoidales bacterium]